MGLRWVSAETSGSGGGFGGPGTPSGNCLPILFRIVEETKKLKVVRGSEGKVGLFDKTCNCRPLSPYKVIPNVGCCTVNR